MKRNVVFGMLPFLFIFLFAGCRVTVTVEGNGNDNTAGAISSAVQVQIASDLISVARVGETTGEEDAFCGGFSPVEANHTMFIDGSLGMTIRVTGAEELGLWVLCGQSNFCGDLVGTNTTEFSRFWTSGSCDIFISVDERDTQATYSLEFIGG